MLAGWLCVPCAIVADACLNGNGGGGGGQFARSLGTFNIGSYILGIGDRHLDNFMMKQVCGSAEEREGAGLKQLRVVVHATCPPQHQTDGSVVGIDFGMAFGGGSSLLPVPELLPFRLTPQFTDLLQPLDTSGLLKSTMVSVP